MGLSVLVSALSAQPETAALAGSVNADGLFSGDGYRMRQYRAPTPASLSVATTLTTSQLQMMLTVHPNPVLVDVVKVPWRQGRFVEPKPHQNIPGSLWLPAAGLGKLPEDWLEHFSDVLAQATEGNRYQAIVFYCKADCWLSWNAARRAHKLGYQRLYWYRDGVDGWRETGLRLEDAEPVSPTRRMANLP